MHFNSAFEFILKLPSKLFFFFPLSHLQFTCQPLRREGNWRNISLHGNDKETITLTLFSSISITLIIFQYFQMDKRNWP